MKTSGTSSARAERPLVAPASRRLRGPDQKNEAGETPALQKAARLGRIDHATGVIGFFPAYKP